MAELPHFILPRAEVELERRKRPGFGTSTPREPAEHSERIRQAVEEALESHARLSATIADPELIVRVRVSHTVPEDQWERAGLAPGARMRLRETQLCDHHSVENARRYWRFTSIFGAAIRRPELISATLTDAWLCRRRLLGGPDYLPILAEAGRGGSSHFEPDPGAPPRLRN